MQDWTLEDWKNAYKTLANVIGSQEMSLLELCNNVNNERIELGERRKELAKVDSLHLNIHRALVKAEETQAARIVEIILAESDFSAV